MIDMLKARTPRARKRHKCIACFLDITPGEVYSRVTFSDEGGVYDWVEHMECHLEVQRLFREDYFFMPEDGCPEGALVQYVEGESLSDEWKEWYEKREGKL